MLFKRFVEAGRLAVIEYGPDAGKLCLIADIIDQNRVLVDGPTTGVMRQPMPISRIVITKFCLKKCRRGHRSLTLKKMLETDDVVAKFNLSSWGQKMQVKKAKAAMSDFDRFKLMIAKQKRNMLARPKVEQIKREARKVKKEYLKKKGKGKGKGTKRRA